MVRSKSGRTLQMALPISKNIMRESKEELLNKLGCVVKMVVDSLLPHAESNDYRKDAFPFILIAWGVVELTGWI